MRVQEARRPGRFPRPVPPRSQPQEVGTDLIGIEVAGAGTTSELIVSNNRGSAYTLHAGTWYEPKDGGAQRMIITRTTLIPSGRFVRVPAACMQMNKNPPANGLRFFSQFKTIRAGVQACQRNCLSRDLDSVQSCVWGCESSSQRSVVVFLVEDACNDRYRVDYRFFEKDGTRTTGIWPSRERIYYTPGFGRVGNTHRLSCTPGRKVCYGAELGITYWGVGIDGDRGCTTGCCVRCPTSDEVRRTVRFSCPRR